MHIFQNVKYKIFQNPFSDVRPGFRIDQAHNQNSTRINQKETTPWKMELKTECNGQELHL